MAVVGVRRRLLLALLVLAAGCKASPKIEIDPEGILTERTDEAIRFDIGLNLANPNDEPLQLIEFVYTVKVDGREVYRGRRDAGATLAAFASKQLVLPAIVPFERAGWAAVPPAADWSIGGDLVYLEPERLSEILLDTGFWEPRAGFNGSGKVRLGGIDPTAP
jgi:hypothetical protein